MSTAMDQMTRVRAWTILKGWRENGETRTLGEEVALLHSEVSEAVEAFRDAGTKRWYVHPNKGLDGKPFQITLGEADNFEYKGKPEGIASELADTYIRLLDNYAERGIDPTIYDENIELARESVFESLMIVGWDEYTMMTPVDVLETLHQMISTISIVGKRSGDVMLGDGEGPSVMEVLFHTAQTAIRMACDYFQIDLDREFDAKMDYNDTREYRHGGKGL